MPCIISAGGRDDGCGMHLGADPSGGSVQQAARLDTENAARRAPLDFDKLLFVKRFTYNSNHYYTEYINSAWMPGGNLCVLNLNERLGAGSGRRSSRAACSSGSTCRSTPGGSSSRGRPARRRLPHL